MMFASDFYLSFVAILFSLLISTECIGLLSNSTISNLFSTDNTTINGNVTTVGASIKNRLDQGKEIIHDAFANMDRGTLMRATIVLAGITFLVLMYIGAKAFFLRKKRQPKRYTLITDPSSMEEPLFGAEDDEEETEDNTLFVRK